MCIKIECCYFIPFTGNKFSSSYVRPIRFYFLLLRSLRWKVGQIAKSEAFPDTWNGGNLSWGSEKISIRVVVLCFRVSWTDGSLRKVKKSLWNCDANLILKSYPLDQKDILFALGMNPNNAILLKRKMGRRISFSKFISHFCFFC